MPSAPWPSGHASAASRKPPHRVSAATRAGLLALALLIAGGCRSQPGPPAAPAWELDGYAGLSAQRQLAGTGRAPGSGPSAQSDARRAALAALVEQIEARVAARTSGVSTESMRLERSEGGETTTLEAFDEWRREVSVAGEAALPGVRFEFATGLQDGAVVTWARAIVERELLIAADLDDSRAALAAAEAGLALAATVLGPGTADRNATDERVPEALQALLRAERQLAAPAQALLRIAAIAPEAGGEAAQLAARLPALQRRQAELLAGLRERLHCEPDGAQPWIPFSGASLETRWLVTLDGRPLPGVECGAQLGQGPLAIARSDAEGRVHFNVPLVAQPVEASVRLRVGPASDVRLGALHFEVLPQRTAIGAARLAIVTCRDVQHADGAPRAAEAAALRQRAAAALDNLGFTPVQVLPGCGPDVLRAATAADYVLTLRAQTRFRSQESGDVRTPGPIWYGTRIEWRLQRVADNLALSGHLPEEHARAAAGTAEAAAQRSFELGLQRLLDPAAADSLPATLHGRLR